MSLTLEQSLADDNAGRAFAENLMARLKIKNIEDGINGLQATWVHHRFRAADITFYGVPMCIDVLNLVVSGDLPVGYIALGLIVPDDMTMPYHWLSAERLAYMRSEIGVFLGYE